MRKSPYLFLTLLLGSTLCLSARLDFSGDGVSELWKLKYPGIDMDADTDADGWSNREEGLAGTDPYDSSSLLKLSLLDQGGGGIEARWNALQGKKYCLERWVEGSTDWIPVFTTPALLFDAPLVVDLEDFSAAFYRVAVSDVDLDNDGLSAWEEHQLGMNDQHGRSSGDVWRSDFNVALRKLEDPAGVALADGTILSQRMPSRAEAVRFLQKSTFGPTKASISEFCSMGYIGWLEAQFAKPQTLTRSILFANALPVSSSLFRYTWWRAANIADDQLRQRVAYALSQILVVNMTGGNVIGDNALIQADYYDIFIEEAFSSYREILEDVTYSPVMGHYLSHLKNRKSDPAINRYPDENFAREIMQLFTIGLWELNSDGTPKYDSQGARIPTYDNSTITEMAKVFTGMSFSKNQSGQAASSFFLFPTGNAYQYPMKVWDVEHEPGTKNIINNVVLDGTQTGEEEVQVTLDALVTHSNIAPFVSRLLIQRFTSSNPSPDYIARVSEAWSVEEGGLTGNLDNVIEAILLDPETLDLSSQSEFRGKVREPVIRFLNLLRAFDFARADGKYIVDFAGLDNDLGQYPTLAPSVFNFYLPDFSPAGEFRANGMVSPELQLGSSTQMILSDNRFYYAIVFGNLSAVPDFSEELALAGDAALLVDHVSELLTGGLMQPATIDAIVSAVESQSSDLNKVRTAVHLVSQSMECVTLK